MTERQLTPGEALLPRPPGVMRRFLADNPLVVDGTIAGGYLFGCLMMATLDGFNAEALPNYLRFPLVLVAGGKTLLVFLALLWRRKLPLLGLIVISLLGFIELGSQALPDGVAVLFALYAVPVYGTVRRGWIAFGFTVACMSVLSFTLGEPFNVKLTTTLISALLTLVLLMFGINMGNRRRYLAALIDRAEQLARERDQRAKIAVQDERARIAREMHDIVAHSLSVMVTLSEGAARAVPKAPEAAADAMLRGAETGRSALAEMRRLLGVLAEDTAVPAQTELTPQPGTQQLPELIASYRGTGLRVELTETGVSSADRGQELAVFRVVQESLTNALRYAGFGARVTVELRYLSDRTVLEVRDAGGQARPESGPGIRGLGSGKGLAGLAQRVRLFGGSLTAGPAVTGEPGWVVRAVIPVNEDAVDTASMPREGAPA
ncbi:sensor histidine kinase [Leucobacter sp. M11]|uniref:sensor histidine kinase n=1 Tax=Leucobacter sp. M11 TaxID=2993565 RepID=UPI002D7F4398|nr:histidine kinase [Leucobacter sp. M11]MEB4615247.1 histidine kinase [Leucobacter sp. M11]